MVWTDAASAHAFRGSNAAASLKRGADAQSLGEAIEAFRGSNAAASLKLDLDREIADRRRVPSAAAMPRPH